MNWQLVCRRAQRYRWNKYGKQSKKKQFNNEKDDISPNYCYANSNKFILCHNFMGRNY
ncbi:hypothetical protein BN168_320062 [Clostridioides difficile CD002]|nr:hypothetical protein BN167_700005 [Clostridioides difficile E13]CCL05991.1 hypothetical protein BN168_320062 [Clostridioides difficile CD002]